MADEIRFEGEFADETDTPDEGNAPKLRPRRDSHAEIAKACFMASLTPGLSRRLRAGSPTVVVVKVPSAQWVDPVASVASSVFRGAKVASFETAPRSSASSVSAAEIIALGWPYIAISQSPASLIPFEVRAASDYEIEVKRPSSPQLWKVMRAVQRGFVPRGFRNLDLSSLDLDELAACIAPGDLAANSAAKLLRAVDQKGKVAARTARVPPSLESAIEYGDARRWALDLRWDLADLRAGRVAPSALDRGCLFYGPPGSGKSLLAQMIGEACGVPLISSSVADWFAKGPGYLGDVIKAQRQTFEDAMSKAPSILFLDEIDALPNPESIDSRGRDFWMPLVLDFFLLLDSAVSARDGLVVIGATNRPQHVSAALTRPGRLERKIFVGPPDPAGLKNIFRHHLGSDLVDEGLDSIVAAAHGATGANVMEWVRAARRRARRAGRDLGLDDLFHIVVPKDDRSTKELWRTAVHEAGHAIAGLVLEDDLLELTLERTRSSGGNAEFAARNLDGVGTSRIEARLRILLAGHAAEVEVFGSASFGSGGSEQSDLARATEVTAMMQASYGAGDILWLCPPEKALATVHANARLADAVRGQLQKLYADSRQIVSRHRSQLLAVAEALLSRRRLSGTEVAEIAGLGGPELQLA